MFNKHSATISKEHFNSYDSWMKRGFYVANHSYISISTEAHHSKAKAIVASDDSHSCFTAMHNWRSFLY